jgi:flagellar hook-associated protein 2
MSSSLSLSGLASGLNWTSIVNELLTVESEPLTQMQTQLTGEQNQGSALTTIGNDLTTLGTDVTKLLDPASYQDRTTSVSNPSIATATATNGTPLGNYSLNVISLATDSKQIGSQASAPLSPSSDVSGVVLSSAGFATPVTAGTFTVNGHAITVTTSETLQNVFDAINTATGGAVTASYNPTSDAAAPDTITLSSSSPITLGSDTDTSNFLQAADLYNNGTGTITSTSSLGGINLNNALGSANLATTITDGGSGAGAFQINGVTINFNASTDKVSDVLQRINNSAAGVTATYDSVNNRFELTDTSTGDVGIAMQDVTGNFLAATGLSTGTLSAGTNLQYSINGGGTLTSQSNTINAAASGLTGLSLTATGKGTTNISVQSDTSTLSSTITSFVNDYNAVQKYISTQTLPTTNATTGAVTPGLFTGNMDVENMMVSLRQLVTASPGAAGSGVENLNDLGITSNGTDNTLSISNPNALSAALSNNLGAVQSLFTNPTTGLAHTLNSYLRNVTGLSGVLSTDEGSLTTQENTLHDSIKNLQAKISSDQTTLTTEFTNMETAINSINQEKNLLNEYFSSSSANAAPVAAGSGISSSSSSSSSSGSTSGG